MNVEIWVTLDHQENEFICRGVAEWEGGREYGLGEGDDLRRGLGWISGETRRKIKRIKGIERLLP